MKKVLCISLLFIVCLPSFADHLKGGCIYYEYLGPGLAPNTSRYRITVKQYMRCDAVGGQLDTEVYLGIFNASGNNLVDTIELPLESTVIEKKSDFSCITNPPEVCYRVDQFVNVVELPDIPEGYIISAQRCCRIIGIVNVANSSDVGLTYTNTIPGLINGQSYRTNSSPVFAQKDTVIICRNSPFTFDFSATDTDGDSLSYSFIEGLTGGNSGLMGARPNPPTLPLPPYFPNAVIPYVNGYSGSLPLGPGVTINAVSGIISGNGPGITGTYVVAVAVKEYRNSLLIGSTRKEIHIDVADCSLTTAQLSPTYYVCDSYSYAFKNEVPAPVGSFYSWNFGDAATGADNLSSSAEPVHIYSDTGAYTIKLKITSNAGCQDSATASVKVFPGFFPGFNTAGQCRNTPIQFLDTTKSAYGNVNAWSWNFGDATTLADTSQAQNPKYTYSSSTNYDVTFFVANSKGCADTIVKTISIKDKPDFTLSNDTLICSIDSLILNISGSGTAFWTPNYNINAQNSLSPLVSPDAPTTYYVTFTDVNGCQAADSVFVDVKNKVTLDAGADIVVCQGDIVQLNPISDALYYSWRPSALLNDSTLKAPLANPLATTTFYINASIGKCQAEDSVTLKVVPAPVAVAKKDTAICSGSSIQLHAGGGSIYTWSPPFYLNDPGIPDPVATPPGDIRYIATVRDTFGCNRLVFDTVNVAVQRIIANAGPRDTFIVTNQPLQLNATGGQIYLWSPSTGLNATDVFNPVAILSDNIEYVVTVSSLAGCTDTDTISVLVYKVPASLYVPKAFTPNGDKLNDVFRPIGVGLKRITYFKVFNRWGVLVYSGNKAYYRAGEGWDGAYKGKAQSSDVFVWIAGGIDYLDKKIDQKGTVTLVR